VGRTSGSGLGPSGFIRLYFEEARRLSTEPISSTMSDGAAGGVLATISNEMVRLHKEHLGRGPTKARTYFAGPDTVVCLLEDSLTPVERSLTDMGEHGRVREIRLLFQYTAQTNFIEAVERATGRNVRAFISGIDAKTDVSSEVFVLEPRGS
jgi:uncharacterized protein YbcI